MVIGDTLQLDSVVAPDGVEWALGEGVEPGEITIATLNPPRVEEEPEPSRKRLSSSARTAKPVEAAEGEEGDGGDAESDSGLRRLRRGVTLSIFRRRHSDAGESDGEGSDRVLIVGLGNPGQRYAKTRHNVGFEVVAELSRRWDLPRAKEKFRGLSTDGRTRPGGPRVAALLPQTFMNESGDVGRARPAARSAFRSTGVVVVYDEIDLPFGEIRSKLGGGAAGHNGMKSLKRAWEAAISGACALASAGPTRPIRRSSPPGSLAGSPSPTRRFEA